MLRFASSRALSNARSVMIRRAEAVQPAGNTEKLLEMGKGDWHKLSVADKAAIYRAEYGQARHEMGLVHAEEDRFVFFGIIATLALSYGLYLGVPLLWNSSVPKTLDQEWKDATKEYLKKQNANPLSGISSKQ